MAMAMAMALEPQGPGGPQAENAELNRSQLLKFCDIPKELCAFLAFIHISFKAVLREMKILIRF